MRNKSSQNTGPMLPGFEMLETAERTTLRPLMSLPAGSPARILATQGQEPELPEQEADYGLSSLELLANFDLDTHSWKTSQRCLTEEWATYSERWPRSGMMRNGIAYRLPTLGHRILEIGYSLWPTPQKSDGMRLKFSRESVLKALPKRRSGGGATDVPTVMMLECGLYPTVSFGEWLMGFPIGWTELER